MDYDRVTGSVGQGPLCRGAFRSTRRVDRPLRSALPSTNSLTRFIAAIGSSSGLSFRRLATRLSPRASCRQIRDRGRRMSLRCDPACRNEPDSGPHSAARSRMPRDNGRTRRSTDARSAVGVRPGRALREDLGGRVPVSKAGQDPGLANVEVAHVHSRRPGPFRVPWRPGRRRRRPP